MKQEFTLSPSFQHCTRSPSQEKEIKRHQHWKGKGKLSLFIDDTISCISVMNCLKQTLRNQFPLQQYQKELGT